MIFDQGPQLSSRGVKIRGAAVQSPSRSRRLTAPHDRTLAAPLLSSGRSSAPLLRKIAPQVTAPLLSSAGSQDRRFAAPLLSSGSQLCSSGRSGRPSALRKIFIFGRCASRISFAMLFKMPAAQALFFVVTLAVLSFYNLRVSGAQNTDPSEVNALRAIRSSFVDPMNHLHTWNSGDPCLSNWTWIFCDAVSNDGYQHIRELQLLKLKLSGSIASELGHLSHLKIFDVMWNKINGSIPKEMGNITTQKLLLMSGNQLSGSIPEEIGYLPNLNRLQIDQNQISGPIPKSFANFSSIKHLHMNNNSFKWSNPT